MSGLLTQLAVLGAASNHLRSYAGGDASQALVGWIDALSAVYKDELVDVAPEGLAALQATVRQLQALRGLASGAVQTNGRI